MRPYGALYCACLVVAGVASVGCSAPVAGDVADASGAITQGVVLVERTVNLSRDVSLADASADEAEQPHATVEGAPVTNVSAKFMRLSTATDPGLADRIVGSPFALPAMGSCMVLSPATGDEATSLSSVGPIELLDVGDVTMRTESTEMPLAARAFPDVGDLIFGVFYTSRDAASDLPAPARYTFESSGSGLLDRFVFEADAPGGPEDVRIGEAPLEDGVEIDADAGVSVRWRAPEDGDAARARDVVYVDVISGHGVGVRCAFKDTGRGVIPGAFLDASTLGPLPASAIVAVHRTRQVHFSAAGVDVGEVRFDFSVTGRALIAAPR